MNWMLMSLLVVGLGMNFVSCVEDEEEKAWHESDPYEKGSDEALDFWTVISQLTDLQVLPDDWKTATFEPTLGTASEADPYTRNIVVQDAAEAVASYSCLIGLSESLPDYTTANNYSNNRVGRLNYSLSKDGKSVAAVEVNIKQMPKLKKIVYVTPEQVGENATLHGSAYYHFGDVIRRIRTDGQMEYWICVNPASHLTGKTESHWISISDLPDENVYTWKRSDGQTVQLPTAICTQYTYIHDFAELIYAIAKPDDYLANLAKPSMTTFSGFSRKNPGYLNQWYFTRIAQAWRNQYLFVEVFNKAPGEMEALQEFTVFCKGYSWVLGKTGTLYTYTYSGPNWRTATWSKPTYNFKDTTKPAFNIHYWGLIGQGNGDWEPHNAYVVRHATGEALCKMAGADYSWKTRISGCEDVYVYNNYFYPNEQDHFYPLGNEPQVLTEEDLKPKEVIKSKPMKEVTVEDIGKIVALDGNIYDSQEDAVKAGTKAVAMVADTRNTNFSFTTNVTMSNSQWESTHGISANGGIAIALENGNVDASKKYLEKESVTVYDYDRAWHESHYVKGAKWYVPNIYHWQRLARPYGCNVFWTITYLRENYLILNSDFSCFIKGAKGFLDKLKAAGVDPPRGTYLMAGGYMEGNLGYMTLGVRIDKGNRDNTSLYLGQGDIDYSRYVLTW